MESEDYRPAIEPAKPPMTYEEWSQSWRKRLNANPKRALAEYIAAWNEYADVHNRPDMTFKEYVSQLPKEIQREIVTLVKEQGKESGLI